MKLDFAKENGLVPAIVQDDRTEQILMLGYMNEEAVKQTLETGLVTFYSRSKQRLWVKGETSNNTLELVNMYPDCDQDALVVRANPNGPTCHTGTTSCFGEPSTRFIYKLERILNQRAQESPEDSYTSRLLAKGVNKVAQKVGEEAVEVVIDAVANNREGILNESADLLYHFLVMLKSRDLTLQDVENVLIERHNKS